MIPLYGASEISPPKVKTAEKRIRAIGFSDGP